MTAPTTPRPERAPSARALPAQAAATLEPVRDALLRAARADAERVLRAAREQAAAVLDRADAQGAGIRDRAVREGEEAAADTARLLRARARRRARGVILQARAELAGAAEQEVRDAAARLTAEPDYPKVLDLLADLARRELGGSAGRVVEVEPGPGGGVTARQGSRELDLSLAALAQRYLDDRPEDLERLWAEGNP